MIREAWTYNGEMTASSTGGQQLAKLDKYMQENETGLLFNPIHKRNSKCIKDLNVNHETIKLLEDNIGKHLLNISMSNFLNPSP